MLLRYFNVWLNSLWFKAKGKKIEYFFDPRLVLGSMILIGMFALNGIGFGRFKYEYSLKFFILIISVGIIYVGIWFVYFLIHFTEIKVGLSKKSKKEIKKLITVVTSKEFEDETTNDILKALPWLIAAFFSWLISGIIGLSIFHNGLLFLALCGCYLLCFSKLQRGFLKPRAEKKASGEI